MKNNFFIHCVAVSLFFASCAVKQMETPRINIFVPQVEQLKLGSTKNEVESILGKTYRVSLPVDKLDYEGWIYDWADQGQRAAVIFDATEVVMAKVFKPFENEEEDKLDFWLKKKYSELKFEIVPSPRCSKDFTPVEVYYINLAQGIVIQFHRQYRYVESVKWMTREKAAETLTRIKSCG